MDTGIVDSIFAKGDDTFQNSPVHLLFYEKVNDDLAPDLNTPELSSMSYCRLRSDSSLKLPELAFDMDLHLVLRGVTA